MPTDFAKVFKSGRSQAVRLPKAYRFAGACVRIRREGRAVILEPIAEDFDAWIAAIDGASSEPFMPEGRQQPPMPTSRADGAFD